MTSHMRPALRRPLVVLYALAVVTTTAAAFVPEPANHVGRTVGVFFFSLVGGSFIGYTWPRRYWEVFVTFPSGDTGITGKLFFKEKKAQACADALNANPPGDFPSGVELRYGVRELFKRERFELTP